MSQKSLRVEADVIKLVDAFPIILDNSRGSSSVRVTVQQVAGGISD